MESIINILSVVFFGVVVFALIVAVHEGGHFFAAKLFKVRVLEFMIGLPGPSIGRKFKGTRFGLTAIPLGGYARIAGMEGGSENPNLATALAYLYYWGELNSEQIERSEAVLGFDLAEALAILEQWGSVVRITQRPGLGDDSAALGITEIYQAPQTVVDGITYAQGQPRHVGDRVAALDEERRHTYRNLGFFKRVIILAAGPLVNVVLALGIFVGIMMFYGLDFFSAFARSFSLMAMVVGAIISLFNPATFGEVVEQSSSLIGVSVVAKEAAVAGAIPFLTLLGALSLSIGLMNLLPIPPLDGGKIIIEIIEKLSGKIVPVRVINTISTVAIVLMLFLFVVVTNSDIQRYILGG